MLSLAKLNIENKDLLLPYSPKYMQASYIQLIIQPLWTYVSSMKIIKISSETHVDFVFLITHQTAHTWVDFEIILQPPLVDHNGERSNVSQKSISLSN